MVCVCVCVCVGVGVILNAVVMLSLTLILRKYCFFIKMSSYNQITIYIPEVSPLELEVSN